MNLNAFKQGMPRLLLPPKIILIMRLIVVIMAVFILQANAVTGYGQKVTISKSNASIVQLFKEINKQTGYDFLYTNPIIKDAKLISLKVSDADLMQVLNLCFSNQPFTYSIKNKTILVTPKPPVTGDVKGKVTESGTGLPISGVTVRLTGGNINIGKMTDANGDYAFKDVPTGSYKMTASYLGFESQVKELLISDGKVLEANFQLKAEVSQLEQVLVIGYGTTQRKDLTGSVASVSSAQIKDLPVSSVDQKLVGQIAGVQISSPTGAPGGGVNIQIRGTGSISFSNSPLFVLDGFAISNTGGHDYNPLNLLNPDDVESVTVLKDASSTAIYGSRGSNGVIVITTKKGKPGDPVVSVNSYIGAQKVPQKGRPKVLNGTEYAQFRKDIIIDEFASRGAVPTDADIPAPFRNPAQYGKGTDWYDAVLRTGIQTNVDASLRGGSESTRYSVSIGRLEQEGTIKYTDYRRYSGNFNLESDLSKKVKLGISLSPTAGTQNRNGFESGQRDVLTRTLWLSPIVPITDANGNRTIFIHSPGAIGAGNPLNTLEYGGTEAKYFRGLATAFAEYKIIDGLKAKYAFNVDYSNNSSFVFNPTFVIGETGASNPSLSIPSSNTAQTTTTNWLSELTLSYDKTFGTDHRVNAVLGYTAQKERYNGYSFGATNYPDDLIETINASTLLDGAGAGIEKWSLLSYLARANYTFKDKYLFTATIRTDGSSRFGKNTQYGTFPSAAFAWRASQEKFLKSIRWINDLKLRASYGQTGNFNIGNYAYASSVGPSNYAFGDQLASGRVSGSIANENLTWEKSRELDLGIDMAVLNDRLSLTVDYYNRITSDLLLNAELPSASGFSSAIVNLGKVRNRGFEFSVNSKNLTGSFRWNTNLNLSLNRNVVLELNPGNNNAPVYSGRSGEGNFTHKTEVGKPIGQFFGFVFDGIYQNAQQLSSQPKHNSSIVGSVRYKDVDGNGIIEAVKDFTVIGDTQPDFTYGITNSFSYKNFDLNVIVVGVQGGQIMRTGNEFLTNIDGVFNVDRKVIDRFRSTAQPGSGLVPTTVGGRTLYREVNSQWIEDASFLRIQNVTLGYNFKQPFITNSRIVKAVRLYASVQNLVTFTKYSGANPQAGTNDGFSALTPGRDFTSYPIPRIITAGINMTF
ncbi:TonB-dependent receptor [Pedobacter hiemivivus]|uniref:SusC/RagA family TonB-linked outer membrane protein n=1 Tax=Pedobacter hiemivivus TaxID=2530454 RepID=A0A4R0NA84_9SPHI|nr:TonB-dependent receptor [Pedobacter hiemivivus]TCC96507.1 SusC/RagA family TonB-linked outer membrane protein [Pedobacter hiemivivus]